MNIPHAPSWHLGEYCAPMQSTTTNTNSTNGIDGSADSLEITRTTGEIFLSHHLVQSLTSLKELLRPVATQQVAATMEELAPKRADALGSQPMADTTSGTGSAATSVATSALPPPPYLIATVAIESTSSAPAGSGNSSGVSSAVTASSALVSAATGSAITVRGAGQSSSGVPALPLLVEAAAQLGTLLVHWRSCDSSERRESRPSGADAAAAVAAAGRPLQPPPLPSSFFVAVPEDQNTDTIAFARNKGNVASPQLSTPPPSRPSPARLLQLMHLLLWYCLATTEEARLAAGGRSCGASGGVTPLFNANNAQSGAVGSTGRGRGGSSTPHGARGARGGWRSGSTSVDPMATTDWLGSRMSSAATSATEAAPAFAMTDDQLAEQLFRAAVDAVVLLQGRPQPIAPAGAGEQEAPQAEEHDMRLELQTVSLWLLAAAFVRFRDAPFNATVFLPILFPAVDVRGAAGAEVRHPLLQPLLRPGKLSHPTAVTLKATKRKNGNATSPPPPPPLSDRVAGLDEGTVSLRYGAAACLTAFVHKLHPTLQYVEEPQPHRQAFLSLGTQCGSMLITVHESICWGLKNAPADAPALVVTPLLNTYSSVVVVTPYHRCPRSRAAVLQTMELPQLQHVLEEDQSSAYVPMTAFVTVVFKNNSMRGAALPLLLGRGITSGGDAGTLNVKSAGRGTQSAILSPFLSALLRHADTRVEVWRALVHLSRFYPQVIDHVFEACLDASVRIVTELRDQEAVWVVSEESAAAEGGAETPRAQQVASVAETSAASATPQRREKGALKSAAAPQTFSVSPAHNLQSPQPASVSSLQETFAECLRTWLHFMGYVWKAFDDNASDPALSPELQQCRASVEQKTCIHALLLQPAMRLRRAEDEVRTTLLRCVAQIGEDFISTLDPSTDDGAELVRYVQNCMTDPQPRLRGEALTTLGVWLWQYPSMDSYAEAAVASAVHALTTDPNALVRTKAGFALSNLTGRLTEDACGALRESPDFISILCATAMQAAVIDTDPGVQGHGIRMMNHLLQVLDVDELISEVPGFEEGVAEGFLRVLLECLRAGTSVNGGGHPSNNGNSVSSTSAGLPLHATPREAKHRWNAAHALGMGLAREEVFEAEPRYSVESLQALCTAVVRDNIFKVRTHAAVALGRLPSTCLAGPNSGGDLTPTVVSALCQALESATSTENFRQYKEQGPLRDALHTALGAMITSSKPSVELDKVFAKYQSLLQKEHLL